MAIPSPNCPSPIAGFKPHPFLYSGHLQTLAAAWRGDGRSSLSDTEEHRVVLPDGDQLIVHSDRPRHWKPSDPVTVLLHGLCGSAASSYMWRIAEKLSDRGQRTVRVNMRGCGAGQGLAKLPYHAGRSADLAAVVESVRRECPSASIRVAGFSLGGNILLKWLGEGRSRLRTEISRAIAVNPPIDLQVCNRRLTTFWGGFYGRHFAKALFRHVRESPHWRTDLPEKWADRRPRRLVDFDDSFTAPRAGYASAEEYYHQCSAVRVIEHIAVPTFVLASRDDPLIPAETLESQNWPDCVKLFLVERGGHLGYLSRSAGADPDRYWMDWRVVDWLTANA